MCRAVSPSTGSQRVPAASCPSTCARESVGALVRYADGAPPPCPERRRATLATEGDDQLVSVRMGIGRVVICGTLTPQRRRSGAPEASQRQQASATPPYSRSGTPAASQLWLSGAPEAPQRCCSAAASPAWLSGTSAPQRCLGGAPEVSQRRRGRRQRNPPPPGRPNGVTVSPEHRSSAPQRRQSVPEAP